MSPPAPELRTDRLELRPATDADLPALFAILRQPSVERWWGENEEEDVRETFLGDPDGWTWTLRRDGEVIGALVVHEETSSMYRHAGLDIFLAEAAQRTGLGPEAIRRAVVHLVEDRGHHRIVIDPSVENVGAIVAYERAGFRRVGILRRYELRGGSWRDGLLMELVVPDPAVRPRSAAGSPAITLVPAGVADVPRILPMMRDFNRHEGIPIDEATLVPALERLLGEPALGGVWLAQRQDALVGYAVLTFGFDLEWAGRDAWLTELWIVAQERRGGAGRAVLEAIEREAARLGARALHLMVRHENLEARALYERAGFRAPLRETLTKKLAPDAPA